MMKPLLVFILILVGQTTFSQVTVEDNINVDGWNIATLPSLEVQSLKGPKRKNAKPWNLAWDNGISFPTQGVASIKGPKRKNLKPWKTANTYRIELPAHIVYSIKGPKRKNLNHRPRKRSIRVI